MEKDKKDDWSLGLFVVIVIMVSFLVIVGVGTYKEHQSRCEEGYERVYVGNTSGCISYEKILEEIK